MTKTAGTKKNAGPKPPPSTKTTTDARTLALDVLERVDAGAWSNLVLPTTLRRSNLDDRDRAFATELVYGTLRHQRRCDHLVALASSRSLARLDPPVRAALRLGAYQLMTGVPPHAAVSATVDAVGRRAPRARGYVNAVLRKVQGLGPEWPWPEGDDPAAMGVRLSYPDWVIERLVKDIGADDTARALATMNDAPRVTLRVNPRRTTIEALTDNLVESGIAVFAGGLVPDGVVVRGTGDPASLPAVRDGRATPQDEASQAVIDLLELMPGMVVLDVAAGPGGKATAMAERVGDNGSVVALELHASRAALIGDASRRLGLSDIVTIATADATALPFATSRQFDRVLVDAPCSGLGVLRRRAEARWRVEPAAVDELAELQRRLLQATAPLTAPGGLLVYSVCTLTAAETTGIDEWAARELPDFRAEPPGMPWRVHGRGGLILPHDFGTDGMYVLRLRRAAAPPAVPSGP